MRVRLWGTRGSVAASGTDTARYGGNTSCVEVRGAEGTLLVLDANRDGLSDVLLVTEAQLHLFLQRNR